MNTAFLLIFTLFSLASFIAILWGADPYSANFPVRILFFVTLFFAFIGLFSFINIWVSRFVSKPMALGAAFRRGFLFSSLVISLILLQAFSALNIGNAIAVFLVVLAAEMIAVYKNS